MVRHSRSDNVFVIRELVGELSDPTIIKLRSFLISCYNIDFGEKNVLDAVKTIAHSNEFDPVLDMLTEAEKNWDGEERIDTWVIKYLGCEDTELHRAIGRKVLIAAAMRARVPGCKFDNITVLEGPEGMNKSTAIVVLAGDDNFSDQTILNVRDKEVQELLTGVWMHENADLAGMKRAEVEHVKAFASRQVDRARPAFGRVVENKKRRSIEWGTTNSSEYLQSRDGNRRFWPLTVGKIDIDGLKKDRMQLLGEAAAAQTAGESLLLKESLWSYAAEAQELRRAKDPWEDILDNIPNTILADTNGHDAANDGMGVKILHNGDGKIKVASASLLTYVLKISAANQHNGHYQRLSAAMKRLGWNRYEVQTAIVPDGPKVRGYWKPCQ